VAAESQSIDMAFDEIHFDSLSANSTASVRKTRSPTARLFQYKLQRCSRSGRHAMQVGDVFAVIPLAN